MSCWKWERAKDGKGYGKLKRNGKYLLSHRYFYETCFGQVPKGLELDHLCRNRWCCNPDHLEAVTPRENKLRGQSPAAQCARRLKCPRGHYYDRVVSGTRRCRRCDRAAGRRYYARKTALDDRRPL
ncbi:MAG: HNH endonuclease signature motif containing protein [Cetobacterium sp.]